MTSPRTAKTIKTIKTAEAARARRLARLAKSTRGARSAQTAVAAALGVGLLLHPGQPARGGAGADASSGWVVEHVALVTADPEPESGGEGSTGGDTSTEKASEESKTSEESTTSEDKPATSEKTSEDKPATSEKPSETTSGRSSEKPRSTKAPDTAAARAAVQVKARVAAQQAAGQAAVRAAGEAVRKVEGVPAAVAASVGATALSPAAGAGSGRPTSSGKALGDLHRSAGTGGSGPTTRVAPTLIAPSAPAVTAAVPASGTVTGVLERLARALVGVPPTSAIGGEVPAAPPLGALVLAQWALFRRGENPLLNRSPIVSTGGAQRIGTGQVVGDLDATDPDGDRLTYTVTQQAANGTVAMNPADGTWTYTPNPGYSGPDSFGVTVRDNNPAALGLGRLTGPVGQAIARSHPKLAQQLFGSHAVTKTISIPGNRAPSSGGTGPAVGTPSPAGVVTGTVGIVDGDGDALTYDLAPGQGPGRGGVQFGPGDRFTYTPSPAARHAAASEAALPGDRFDSFVVTVSDGKGGVTQVPITVPILGADENPVAAGTPIYDQSPAGVVTGNAAGSATDGDPQDVLVFGGSRTTPKGELVVNPDGTFTYTPSDAARHAAAKDGATDADKQDSFVITVSDGHGGRTAIPVTVTIPGANTSPVAEGTPTVGTPGGAGVVEGDAGSARDADGDTLTYSGSARTPRGTVVVEPNGTFTYTPDARARHAAAAEGAPASAKQDSFTVTVSDGHGGTETITVTVPIDGANVQPVVSGPPVVGAPASDGAVVGNAGAVTDADGDTLTYTGAGSTPKGVVVVNPDGTFTYTPSATARRAAAKDGATTADRQDTVTMTVSDGHGGTTTVSVAVPISPANQAPTAAVVAGVPDGRTGVVGVGLTTADGDGDPVTVTFTQPAAGTGTVVRNADGTFTYTPYASARTAAYSTGPKKDAFTVTLTDGYGGRTTVPVEVTVGPSVVDVGSNPYDIDFTPDGTKAWITNHDADKVTVVDLTTNVVTAVVQLPPGARPGDIELSKDGRTAYVANLGGNSVSAIDTTTFGVTTFPAGSSPGNLAVSNDGGVVYVANAADATVTVMDAATGRTLGTIPVGPRPSGIDLSSDGRYLYVTDESDRVLRTIDTTSNSVVETRAYSLGGDVRVSPDGRYLYTSDRQFGYLQIEDTRTGRSTGLSGYTNDKASDLELSPDGTRAFQTFVERGLLREWDAVEGRLYGYNAGPRPTGVKISSDGRTAYVVGEAGTMTVVALRSVDSRA